LCTDESEVRRFISALTHVGNRAAAVRFWEKFEKKLRDELDLEPSEETRKTGAEIKAPPILEFSLTDLQDRPDDLQRIGGEATESHSTSGRPETPANGERTKMSPLTRILVLAGVALAVWVVGQALGNRVGEDGAMPEETERIVVLPLENLTVDPELDSLGHWAADHLAHALERLNPLPVVMASTVQNTVWRLPEDATGLDVAQAVRANHAFVGTIDGDLASIRMTLELIDVRTGRAGWAFDPVSGPADSAEALISQLAVQAVVGIIARPEPNSFRQAQIGLPVSFEAHKAFQRQRALFILSDYEGSIEEGRRALSLSPAYIPALQSLWASFWNLQKWRERDSIGLILEGLKDRMTRMEYLRHEANMGRAHGDPVRATWAAEEGFRLDPVGWAPMALQMAWRTNRMTDAIERFYAQDRVARPGARPWIGLWVNGDIPFHALGRYEEELELAREGLEYWPNHPILMDAQRRAFIGMGRLDLADSVLRAQEALPPPPPGYDPAIWPVNHALELRAHGYEAEADALFDEALQRFTSSTTSTTQSNLGSAYYYAHRWSEAAPILQKVTEEDPENLYYLGQCGVALAKLGDRGGALAMVDRVRQLDWPGNPGDRILVQGRIMAALGDKDEAIRLFQEAAANGGMLYNGEADYDPAFDDLRGYPPFETLMRPR
jgi:tetratricopeptide (TPR) repeat protein